MGKNLGHHKAMKTLSYPVHLSRPSLDHEKVLLPREDPNKEGADY
jgi:hypothetical protein